MLNTQQLGPLKAANCDLAVDNLTRQLYATDASPYQIIPQAVAFPKSAAQASAIIQAAAAAGVPVTPRGAGTGLSGGAIGEGVVIDFARHNRQIGRLDLERRTGARRGGRGAGPIECIFAPAPSSFPAGRGNQFARDAGRDDRQRFLRLARADSMAPRECTWLRWTLSCPRRENG